MKKTLLSFLFMFFNLFMFGADYVFDFTNPTSLGHSILTGTSDEDPYVLVDKGCKNAVIAILW